MAPPKPNPPPAKNRWFQRSGRSAVKCVSVSITPETRQCATFTTPEDGAGTTTASVIFVPGSARLLSDAQSTWEVGAAVSCARSRASDHPPPSAIKRATPARLPFRNQFIPAPPESGIPRSFFGKLSACCRTKDTGPPQAGDGRCARVAPPWYVIIVDCL